MNEVILDANVWVDILIGSRPRHQKACKLYDQLIKNNYVIKGPMTLHFEIRSALFSEREKPGMAGTPMFASDFRPSNEIKFFGLPIDAQFVRKYSIDLPRIKGDIIYLAMAKVDNIDFITEDDKCYTVARKIGIKAYKIDEYFIHWDITH